MLAFGASGIAASVDSGLEWLLCFGFWRFAV